MAKPRKVSIYDDPNHAGDMPEGTLRAILKQADISQDAFLDLK
jgi:predicted RNA binding protein YcfA (HicA-like mRNA interferase family)